MNPTGRPAFKLTARRRQKLERLVRNNPAISHNALADAFNISIATWKRLRERDDRVDRIIATARERPLQDVDRAMIEAAVMDKAPAAAKLVYQRMGGLREHEEARAQATSGPSVIVNVIGPSDDHRRLIVDAKEALEAQRPNALPDRKPTEPPPGSVLIEGTTADGQRSQIFQHKVARTRDPEPRGDDPDTPPTSRG